MRKAALRWACAFVLLLALGSQARAGTVQAQYVTDGASGNAWTYGPDASVYLSVSQTTALGRDGSAQAFLSFNAISGAWPGDFAQIGGSGFIPAALVSANADRIDVAIENLTSIPGFYLSGYRCVQQVCDYFTPTAPVPVRVSLERSRNYTVQMTGTRRLHSVLVFPEGTTYDETQNGTVSYSEATIEGVVADTAVPVANPVASSASISLSRGVIVWVMRSTH